MAVVVNRFEVHLVSLDPVIGSEIRKTRPCLVISPDEMNRHLATVIIAPMTRKGRPYPSRVSCRFKGKQGSIVLDQIRTVDRARLVRNLGSVDLPTRSRVLQRLAEIFAP